MLTAIFKAVLSMLALLIGISVIVWVLYNNLIQRQPAFQPGPGFGIGPIMVVYGVYWGRQSLAYFRDA